MKLSERASRTEPSVTLEIAAKAKKLKKEGKSVIAFTAGEPDMNTPDFIVEEAKRAISDGFTKYTPVAGTEELRTAVANKFKRVNGIECGAENVVVSCGAKSSLYHVFAALLNDGDEVIVPSPYWITYVEQIRLCGGNPVIVNTQKDNRFKLTASELTAAVTEKTRILILNSPNNPTGAVYTREELTELAVVCEKFGIDVISDEIYERLIFDGKRAVSFATVSDYAKEHTVTVDGVSKSYAMTGWRVGYICAPKEVAKAVAALQGHTTSNACSFAQRAAVEALNRGDEEIEKMRLVYEKRRRLLVEGLKRINGLNFVVPDGAFYVFVDVSAFFGGEIKSAKVFAAKLLDNGVAVVPGEAFGDGNCIRLSYALSEEDIAEGVKRIADFTASLTR